MGPTAGPIVPGYTFAPLPSYEKRSARHALDGSRSWKARIEWRLCLRADDMSHSAQYY